MERFAAVLFFFVLVQSTTVYSYPLTPNLDITPSSICDTDNPDFTEYRYKERIPYCKRNVSSRFKAYIYDLYNISERCRGNYTIDHFIPLSIGGDNTLENLWPEHKQIKAERPNLEYDIYLKLKNGKITQKQAVQIIYDEKTTFGQGFVDDDGC
ncbi:MAG: HNH endonuclease [Bdellovibrionales bacterium]|nr:HNH endonuclease [Bdellovibrionales bacterium]